MIFQNDKESMEWKILRYQYPEAEPSTPEEYNYDANWLTIQVCHRREGYGPAVFRESFLLTYELNELVSALKELAAGDRYYYHAEFVEPVLEVEVNRHRDHFQVSFDLFFDNYEMMVADSLSEEAFAALVAEMEELARAYPER